MNSEYFNSLDRGTQHLIEWQYNMGGHFNDALFKACCYADEGNLYRLSQGFSAEVTAYRKYTRENGWWQKIQRGLFPDENHKRKAQKDS